MPAYSPQPGTVIAGRYRLESLLTQGGMGTLWKARHQTLNSPIAVKFMGPMTSDDSASYSRFMLEARSAAALRSTHIVQVFDYGVEQDTPFIAMEFLQGQNLASRLRQVGTLLPAEMGRLLIQIAKGIAHAHRMGIIHRDLKPENIFLVREGQEEVVKILDFGIVKTTRDNLQTTPGADTRTGALLGTPFYVSPEQAEGNRDVDHRSDLWAIGVITYECLTGRRPFESDGLGNLLVKICTRDPIPPSQIAQVPRGFDEWFLRATDKDREKRFQSSKDLVDSYLALLTTRPVDLADSSGASDGPTSTLVATDPHGSKAPTPTSVSNASSISSGAPLSVTHTPDRARLLGRRVWTVALAFLSLVVASLAARNLENKSGSSSALPRGESAHPAAQVPNAHPSKLSPPEPSALDVDESPSISDAQKPSADTGRTISRDAGTSAQAHAKRPVRTALAPRSRTAQTSLVPSAAASSLIPLVSSKPNAYRFGAALFDSRKPFPIPTASKAPPATTASTPELPETKPEP